MFLVNLHEIFMISASHHEKHLRKFLLQENKYEKVMVLSVSPMDKS